MTELKLSNRIKYLEKQLATKKSTLGLRLEIQEQIKFLEKLKKALYYY